MRVPFSPSDVAYKRLLNMRIRKIKNTTLKWRRSGSQKIASLFQHVQSRRDSTFRGSPPRWASITAKIGSFAPYTFGNTVSVMKDTGACFQMMWDAVDGAKKEILWVTYICKDDVIGKKTVEKLVSAARRGVKVTLLYDDGGNISGRTNLMASLMKETSARVHLFKPMLPHIYHYYLSGMKWRYSPGIRNHRKILVVDDAIGFIGGLNIGAEYAGTQIGGTGRFRDSMYCLSGPCIADLKSVVYDTLESSSTPPSNSEHDAVQGTRVWRYDRQRLQSMWKSTRANADDFLNRQIRRCLHRYTALKVAETFALGSLSGEKPGGHTSCASSQDTTKESSSFSPPSLIQVLASNSLTRRYEIQAAYRIALNASQRRVWITTPYFLPSRKLFLGVLRAAQRGVEVRILTGSWSTTDPWFMWYASQYVTYRLLRGKVQLYEYEGKEIMHAKTVVVDGVWCSVGSFNWDLLSNRILEVSVVTPNYHTAQQLERHFMEDLAHSKKVTLESVRNQSLWVRLVSRFFYHGLRLAERCTFWRFPHREVALHLD